MLKQVFYILAFVWLVLCLCFVISLCIPVLREKHLYAYLAIAVCLLNVVIQVVNICMR